MEEAERCISTLKFSGGGQTVQPINTMPDGTARTIKGQYSNSSIQNFELVGTFGSTGVVQIWKLKKQP